MTPRNWARLLWIAQVVATVVLPAPVKYASAITAAIYLATFLICGALERR